MRVPLSRVLSSVISVARTLLSCSHSNHESWPVILGMRLPFEVLLTVTRVTDDNGKKELERCWAISLPPMPPVPALLGAREWKLVAHFCRITRSKSDKDRGEPGNRCVRQSQASKDGRPADRPATCVGSSAIRHRKDRKGQGKTSKGQRDTSRLSAHCRYNNHMDIVPRRLLSAGVPKKQSTLRRAAAVKRV